MNCGHVLLVDGDLDAQLRLARQLDALGWQALAVNNGAEALRAASQELRIDVLITAIGLPDMDGRRLAAAVCRDRPFTRVVFLGDARGEGGPDAARLLVKPCSTTALRDAVSGARPYQPASSQAPAALISPFH